MAPILPAVLRFAMKISLNWLQDFITLTTTDPDEINRRITAGVAEVDEVEVLGKYLPNCCVGKILSLAKHPQADRLQVCEIQTDRGQKHIVCGGTNLRVGMCVALAHVGATVKAHTGEEFTLAPAKIRGETSEGMICAAEELELTNMYPSTPEQGARPVIDLGSAAEAYVGKPLKEYLGLDDIVLHIDNHAITHRADLFSHVGFAREFVALGLGTWKEHKKKKAPVFPTATLPFTCDIEDQALVPRYEAAYLEISGLGETPAWMKSRLEATGWRSISLPIDITNYVMMETGMPHHAFDAGDFRGNIHIRRAKKGEKITTLDNEERELAEGALVISDEAGIFDLFGIMGGLRSSTKDSTKKIYLQAGIPDPVSIRRTVIAMGHRTDAATVYEKGVPKHMSKVGLYRAIELFLELVPGAKLAGSTVSWGEDGVPGTIELSLAFVEQKLGITVDEKMIKKILSDLEFEVKKGAAKDTLAITVPLHRLGDVKGPHDLVEEIGRVVGYDSIPAVLPPSSGVLPPRNFLYHQLRDQLSRVGYTELVPVSITGPEQLQKAGLPTDNAVRIADPLGEELSLLQTSTIPALLEHAERNIGHAGKALRTFHPAKVFTKPHTERRECSLLLASTAKVGTVHELPFFTLKSELQSVFAALQYRLEALPAREQLVHAHPGRAADLYVPLVATTGGEEHPSLPVGHLYELHPDLCEKYELPARTAIATLFVDQLLVQVARPTVPVALPQFPGISYDVTFPMSARQSAVDLLRMFRGAHPLLVDVSVVDAYSPEPVTPQDYQLTIHFTYRAADRTLSEAEVKPVHEKVLARAK